MSASSPPRASESLAFEVSRETLAGSLSAARIATGLSQKELAASAGLSRATMVQLEGGEGDPRLSTLSAIAEALGVSPVFLLLRREDMKAIALASDSKEAKRVRKNITDAELETMRRLLRSGIAKNRAKALAMGAGAAAAAGLAAGAVTGAAIGSVLLPGVGTAIGAALGSLLSRGMGDKPGDD